MVAQVAAGQDSPSREGGLFLLLPVGARSVGMGQTAVATVEGSEAVWWNPSALAVGDRGEAAVHHSQSILGTGDALAVVVPSQVLGTLALSVDVLNYGDQELSDPSGNPLGTLIPRSVVYGASYASSVGPYFDIGLSYKVVQLRVDCSGPCPTIPTGTATTSALDFGARYGSNARRPLTLGVALRNVGLPFQVNDSPQADPLPTRLQLGASYGMPFTSVQTDDVMLLVATDLLGTLRMEQPSARVGADVSFQRRVHLRAGYVLETGDGSGPSIGFGISSGSLVFDIGRLVRGLSADQGQAPTYVSLRYLF